MPGVTAATRLVALLGHPVAHSISPQIHNAAFQAAGIDAVYVALDVDPDRIDAALDGLQAIGFFGANVTVPHKRAVYLRIPRRAHDAEVSGAANTLFWDGETLAADNTDVQALRDVLAGDVGLTGGEGVVLFGTGGAARAAAVALGQLGVTVEVVGRREESINEIRGVATTAGAVSAYVAEPKLVINATPVGLHGEALPDRFLALGPGQIALDLVYGPSDTPFLAAARAQGAQALDGRGMLVAQAAAAFERWTGVPAPRDVMTKAAEAALHVPAQPGGESRR